MPKHVYTFGGGKADGNGTMKGLLGGKGANLADMCRLGIPVPAGFTITTEVCNWYYDHGRAYPETLRAEVDAALGNMAEVMGKRFGDPQDPLLVSVRSGARASMPGMMETVLNVGLCSRTIPGLVAKTGNERFVYDAYRRLMMMYADVVMEKAAGREVAEGKGIRVQLEHRMEDLKRAQRVPERHRPHRRGSQGLCDDFKAECIRAVLGQAVPRRTREQLWGAVGAVFQLLERQAGHRTTGGSRASPTSGAPR